jgi:hypothetical protein
MLFSASSGRKLLVLLLPLVFSVGGCAQPQEKAQEEPPAAPSISPEEHAAEIEAFRAEREANLRKPNGWLSLVGLHWLEEGANPFGSGAKNKIVFPEKAPEEAGVFLLEGETVSVSAADDSGLQVDGAALPAGELVVVRNDNAEEGPTPLTLGSLSFYAIRRGDRFGIRVKDSESAVLRNFHGLDAFPTDFAWRIEGRFEPYDPPKVIPVPNVLGTVSEEPSPGALVFEVAGTEYRLDPTGVLSEPLFVIFGDATNGKETYGAGRFLYVDPPDEQGRVVLDFNRAYNPPCIFTPYATCPLPPKGNKLPIRVEAGEKTYGEGHE